jgi:hypothetical protein
VNSEWGLVETWDQGEAVAAWTLHYEADLDGAVRRAAEMREHGIPDGHVGEWLGANLALTSAEHRCEHFGDDRNCPHCHRERRQADREASRERRGDKDRLKEQSDTIERQSEALERQSAEIRRLKNEKVRLQQQMAARRPRRRLFRRTDGTQ